MFIYIYIHIICIKWAILVFPASSPGNISIFDGSLVDPEVVPLGESSHDTADVLKGTAPELQQRVGDTQMVKGPRVVGKVGITRHWGDQEFLVMPQPF